MLITFAAQTDRMTDKPTWSHNLSQLNVIHSFSICVKLPYVIQVLGLPECCKLINTHKTVSHDGWFHYTTVEKNWQTQQTLNRHSLFTLRVILLSRQHKIHSSLISVEKYASLRGLAKMPTLQCTRLQSAQPRLMQSTMTSSSTNSQ